MPKAETLLQDVNPVSKKVIEGARIESLAPRLNEENRFQFIRQGYFIEDIKDSREDHLVFNRIVSLKSSYKEK